MQYNYLQVMQPVLDRPLVILLAGTTGFRGCFLGRPLGRFCFTWVPFAPSGCDTVARGASFRSSMLKSSSVGSSFGMVRMSSDPCSQCGSFSPSSRSANPMLQESAQDDDAE